MLAPLVQNQVGEFRDVIEKLKREGFVRARLDREVVELDRTEPIRLKKNQRHTIEAVVDRLVVREGIRARLTDSVETALTLKPLVANANHCEVIIAPVFIALKSVADRLEGSNIKVAAQNCATEKSEGAYTGEVAAFMIHDAGCSHVIVGHSERRLGHDADGNPHS